MPFFCKPLFYKFSVNNKDRIVFDVTAQRKLTSSIFINAFQGPLTIYFFQNRTGGVQQVGILKTLIT